MNRILSTLCLLTLIFSTIACSSNKSKSPAIAPMQKTYASSDRLLIKSATIRLEVKSPEDSLRSIQQLVVQEQGYVSRTNDYDKESISIEVKISAKSLDTFLNTVASYGKVTSQSLSVKDVTAEMIDIDAKLINLSALRDKFRKLLDSAKDVKDILAIETELNRIQTELDTIAAHKKSLTEQMDLSDVDIYLEKQTIYGPLGYIWNSVYWVGKKLFVLN